MPIERRSLFPKEGNHWDLIISRGEKFCFVCDKPITSKQKSNKQIVCIGKDKYGNYLHRHKKCSPLSENWKKKFKNSNI